MLMVQCLVTVHQLLRPPITYLCYTDCQFLHNVALNCSSLEKTKSLSSVLEN